jgi:hypothetical protein
MNSPLPMHLSPRCSAKSKRTGEPCKAPAVTGWSVCRCHGAGGGAPKGARNGNYRHGGFTCEAIAERQDMAAWVRMLALEAKRLAV